MKIKKINSHSLDSPIILTNQSRDLLINNRKNNLNSDIKLFLQDNPVEKTPTPKTDQFPWRSLNNLTKTKLQKNSNDNNLSINLYKLKPLSQQIISNLKPKYKCENNINKSANYNEYVNEYSQLQNNSNYSSLNKLKLANVPKMKIKLESISISNSPRMNLIRFKKLMHNISGYNSSSIKLGQKQTDCKNYNSSKKKNNNKENHFIKSPLKVVGEKCYINRQTPKVRTIQNNVNIINDMKKQQKERYLQYIEGNLKESRKLYIQNNISCLRGNRQKMRFTYNPFNI